MREISRWDQRASPLLGQAWHGSDTGRLHYAGRTTHLTDAQAGAVAPLLVAAIGGHPWPAQLTVNRRSKPTGYHQVRRLPGQPKRPVNTRRAPLRVRRRGTDWGPPIAAANAISRSAQLGWKYPGEPGEFVVSNEYRGTRCTIHWPGVEGL